MAKRKQLLFHPGNCLNSKKPYPRECRLCLQYCPHGAITETKDIITDKCSECGVCMAVCPSDGFVDRDTDRLGGYLFESDKPVLYCPAAQPGGYEIPCLGILDRDAWATILLLSENKEYRILTGDCGSCDDRHACVASVAALKDVLAGWDTPHRVKIEVLPYDPAQEEAYVQALKNANEPRSYNRPASLREFGKNKVKSFLPAIEAEEVYPIPKTRQWFAKALALNPDKKITYKAVKAGDQCTSCGVCAKICPQGALSQVHQEGKVRLIYEPHKCVQCKRCVDICGPHNLKLENIGFSHRFLTGKVLLSESVPKYCAQCGKQIFHNKEPQLCMPCASKDPSLKGVLY